MLMRTFGNVDELFRRFESDLADLFGRTGIGSSEQGRLLPRMEVRRTDSEFVIRAELPGVDPDSVDVTMQDSALRIRAERRVPADEQGEYLRREFAYGTFDGSVVLPTGIDPEKLSANYEDGILEVRVPFEGPKAVKVPVQVGSEEKPALKAAS